MQGSSFSSQGQGVSGTDAFMQLGTTTTMWGRGGGGLFELLLRVGMGACLL